MTISPDSILFGEYKILGELGQGGMGSVYRALHLANGGECAIKVIRADQSNDPVATEFFLREAQALLDVQHEAVVRCHELRRDETRRFYLVMELLDGPNLTHRLEQGPLSTEETHALFRLSAPALRRRTPAASSIATLPPRTLCCPKDVPNWPS